MNTETHREIDWRSLTDGRPHRLKRGLHFECAVPEFGDAARQAADSMGKSVLIGRDRQQPRRFVWVQFVDAEIPAGAPCPCGSAELERVGVSLARCRRCAAVLSIMAEESAPAPSANAPDAEKAPGARPLDTFAHVQLDCYLTTKRERRLVGFGVDRSGRKHLLVVRVPLRDDALAGDGESLRDVAHEILFEKALPDQAGDPGSRDSEAKWEILL